MSALVLKVESLSKCYRLGTERRSTTTLKESFAKKIDRVSRRMEGTSLLMSSDLWALCDVSFEVRGGEVVGIIGPNGAGKSTLLKVLARIVEPTSGRITVYGRVGALLEVGTGFHGDLTGRENVYLSGAILGMSRTEIASKFDEIVEFSGVERFIDTPVKRYSNGMYLRLAFAVAAHVDPDVLIVDEALTVGDGAFQRKCLARAETLATTGRTVLLVSHQMSVVKRLCSRVILIEGGKVSADGATADVLQLYLSSSVRPASEEPSAFVARTGRGRARLSGVEVVGPAGPPTTGDPATFVFHVVGGGAQVSCAFSIYDEFGEVVAYCDSDERSPQDGIGPTIQCYFPILLLRPGRYWLNAALTSQDGVIEDHVRRCASFEVLSGIVDGRPILPAGGYGSIAMPHRWTLKGSVGVV